MKHPKTTYISPAAKLFPLTAALLCAALFLCADTLHALPRAPVPRLPELAPVIFYESFDEYYTPAATNTQISVSGFGTFDESWSGYALQRSGGSLTSFLVPGVNAAGHTNLISGGAGGALRFWVSPAWDTASDGLG